MARFGVIAGFCAARSAASVLDIGCGDGLLASRLGGLEAYVGVDISPVAVERATARQIPRASFTATEAQAYTPDRSFDLIIFNEVLYYLEHPERVALGLQRFLNPDGAFIASVHKSPRHQWVWRELSRSFQTVDGFCVQHVEGSAWDMRVLRPQGAVV